MNQKNEFEEKVNLWIKESLSNFTQENKLIFWDYRFNIPGYRKNIILPDYEKIDNG